MNESVEVSATIENGNKKMTFEELKRKAWEYGEPQIRYWQERLTDFTKRNASQISGCVRILSLLYGQPAPDKIVVSLHCHPNENSEKGEPVNNFEDEFIKAVGDILYWVSNNPDLPTDTERDRDIRTAQTVGRILHEAQHQFFQGERFRTIVTNAEQDPYVTEVLNRVFSSQENYIQTTIELLTTYIESYLFEKLSRAPAEKSTDEDPPIVYKVDQKNFGTVLETVIKADVEKWNQNGPYTALRKGWERKLGRLPEGYESSLGQLEETKALGKKPSVYEIARNLDTRLAEEYAQQGKPIDEKFIVRLYEMVSQNINTPEST